MRMKERRRYLAAKTKWNQTDSEMRRIKESNEQAIHQEAKQQARAQRREEEYALHKQVLNKKKSDERERAVRLASGSALHHSATLPRVN